MVEGMNLITAVGRAFTLASPRRAPIGAVILALACALPATGADMNDPTRPPTGFSEQPQAKEAPREAPLLVSTVFLMGARPYAILDGQEVRVGDKLEAGRVVKIDEHGVWLKTPLGSRQLKLLPDVKKLPARKSTMEKP